MWFRRKPDQWGVWGARDWQIWLDVAVKAMRDCLLPSLCPMKRWQDIYFTVSSFSFKYHFEGINNSVNGLQFLMWWLLMDWINAGENQPMKWAMRLRVALYLAQAHGIRWWCLFQPYMNSKFANIPTDLIIHKEANSFHLFPDRDIEN